jgi:outer membrane protein
MKKMISLLLASLGLAASAANAADLMSVYRDAAEYDAQFAAARASLDAGREKLPQGRSGLLPMIGVGASTTWNQTEFTLRTTPTITQKADYNSNGWTATLTQPLFRWQNWASYKQGELAVAVAEAQFAAARQDLMVRAAQAYFDVLLAQETAATAVAQKEAITQQLESAKRNFEVGTATITDTHEAQARYDLAVATELATQNDLTVKRQALQVVIGKEPDVMKALKSGAQIGRPQPDDMAKWAESAEGGNFAVAQAQAAFEIANQEVSKQRGGHLPTLDIVATYGRSGAGYGASTGGVGVDTKGSTVGLQLAVPIFAGGAIASRDR